MVGLSGETFWDCRLWLLSVSFRLVTIRLTPFSNQKVALDFVLAGSDVINLRTTVEHYRGFIVVLVRHEARGPIQSIIRNAKI